MINETPDSVQIAMELGRLDFVSALLASIALLMTLGGILAFINIKAKAENIAREVAKKKAEEVANIYLQDSLPAIIEAYDEFIEHHVNATVANQIAQAQEDTE